MRIFFRQIPRTFVLVSNNYALTLQAVGAECLIDFQPIDQVSLEAYTEVVSQSFHGLLGVLSVKEHTFLAVVTEQSKVGSPRPSETVYRVKDVELYCLSSAEFDTLVMNRFKSDSSRSRYEDEHPCSRIRKLLNNGFFYSRDFDLTNVLQQRGLQGDYHQMFNNYEKRYLWNKFMLQELLRFRERIMQDERDNLDRSEFLTFLVRGFVKTLNVIIDGEDSLITVISRISCAKSSGPFGLTGVDEDGHVSNYIESEILFYDKNHYFSYAQLRGNVPIFYEVENPFLQNRKIYFPKSKEMNAMVFDKHFDSIVSRHGQPYVINGLKNKSGEEELSNRYNYFVKKRGIPLISVTLSKESLKKSPHKLSYMVKDAILEIGAFCYDIRQKVYIGKQLGIFRINTLNSMEKPGMIEKVISKDVLDISLTEMGLSFSTDLVMKHNMLWDENNAALIHIYERSIRRKTKKTIVGISQNVVRLIDPIHDYISQELEKRKQEYSSSRRIRIFSGTFNVNAGTTDEDLSSWIFPHDNEIYDLAVIGLEEVVELTTSQMLNTDDLQKKKWEFKLKRTLGQRERYSLVSSDQLGGIVLMLFVRDNQLSEIKEVETTLKKTGFGGISANKGGVGLSFLYSSTRFCCICAHLAAGLEHVDQRHSDYKTIAQSMRFGTNRFIKDHDAIIWLGDFNYRITLGNAEVRDAVMQGDYAKLFEYDQLSNQMIAGESFPYFIEMEIKFPPTYKFDKGTSNYDTSDKYRIPAWTDRILSRASQGVLTQLSYGSAPEVTFSDHRPVYATFDAQVIVIDEKKQDALTKELYEKRKLELMKQPAKKYTSLEQRTMKAHGLPRPSSDKVKWWLDGGVKVDLDVPEGKLLNPDRANNPFVVSDIPEFI
jgi:hypothetical protein